jgi:lactoylglutathione lyase
MLKLTLSILGFSTDTPQSQFLSGNLAPARSSEVAEKNVLEWVENDKRRTHASWCL